MLVMSARMRPPGRCNPAFSLLEMAVVMAVLMILTTVGICFLDGVGGRSRHTAADMLAAMVEQASTAAITSRSYVVLVVAEPVDLRSDEQRCRLGLFKVDSWPDSPATTINCVQLGRWRAMESGIALIGGQVDGVDNLMDGNKLTIAYGAAMPLIMEVHAIAFNPYGKLHHPAGSAPVALRIAKGSYRGGRAIPDKIGGSGLITENRLLVGRVTSRPYRIDG